MPALQQFVYDQNNVRFSYWSWGLIEEFDRNEEVTFVLPPGPHLGDYADRIGVSDKAVYGGRLSSKR